MDERGKTVESQRHHMLLKFFPFQDHRFALAEMIRLTFGKVWYRYSEELGGRKKSREDFVYQGFHLSLNFYVKLQSLC